MPIASLQKKYNKNEDIFTTIRELAHFYKVSALAILLRLKNTQLLNISEHKFWQIYNEEKNRILEAIKGKSGKSSGGNFYNTKPVAVSKRFLRALVSSAREGQTLYRDAMSLANVKKIQTFHRLADKILTS